MKVLVDPITNTIHGLYEEPLLFDISGHYVIDIPPQIGSVSPNSDPSVTDLVTQKENAWVAYFEAAVTGSNLLSDELLDPSVVVGPDAANSTGVEIGPRKRTVIYPGGTLLTKAITVTPSLTPIKMCLHVGAFSLYRSPVDIANPASDQPIPKLLYGYNPNTSSFETFDPSLFSVAVCQSGPPFTPLAGSQPIIDSTTPGQFSTFPSSIRLKFVNNATIPYHLSDWYLVHQ